MLQQPAPAQPQGTYQVWLNVYDVAPPTNSLASNPDDKGMSSLVVKLNNFGRDLGLGGVFHGAVQIDNWEWSYGFCEHGTGVYVVEARRNPMYQFRETIDLGYTPRTKQQIKDILHRLKQQWQGPSYELLSHNCCHFCEAFAGELEVKPIPTWVNRLATSADATVTFTNQAVAVAQNIGNSVTRTANSGYSWLRESVAKLLAPGPNDPQHPQQQSVVMVGSLSHSGGTAVATGDGRPTGRNARVLGASTARLQRPGGSASHDGSPLRTGSHNLSDSLAFAAAMADQGPNSLPGSAINMQHSHHDCAQTSVWANSRSNYTSAQLHASGREGDTASGHAPSGLGTSASASGGVHTARRRAHPFASLRLGLSSNNGIGGAGQSQGPASTNGSSTAPATQSKAYSMTATASCLPGVGPLFRGGLRDEGSILHQMGTRSASYSGTSQHHHHNHHTHVHPQQHRLAGATAGVPHQPRESTGGNSCASADHAVLLPPYWGSNGPAPSSGHHSVPSSPLIHQTHPTSSPGGAHGPAAGKQRSARSNSARMQSLLTKLSGTLKSAAPSSKRPSSMSGTAGHSLPGLQSGPPSLAGQQQQQPAVLACLSSTVVGSTTEAEMQPSVLIAQQPAGVSVVDLSAGDKQQQEEAVPSFLLERLQGSGLPVMDDSEGAASDAHPSSQQTSATLEPPGLAQPCPLSTGQGLRAAGDGGSTAPAHGAQGDRAARTPSEMQPLSTRQACMDLTGMGGSTPGTNLTSSHSQPPSAHAGARLRNPFEDDDEEEDELGRALGQLMMTGTETSGPPGYGLTTSTADGSPQPNIARTAFLPPEWLSDWGATGSDIMGATRSTTVFSRAGVMLSSNHMGAGDGGSMPLLNTAGGGRQLGPEEPLAELSGLSALLDDGRRSTSLPVTSTGPFERGSCDEATTEGPDSGVMEGRSSAPETAYT